MSRIIVSAATIFGTALVLGVTAGEATSEHRPVASLGWVRTNALAKARWASKAIAADTGGASRDRAVMLAQEALRRDASASEAWRTLALAAKAQGDSTLARRRFATVGQLTKRDQVTHMWLVTQYTRAGRSDALMNELDLALRTSSSNWDQLLPILVTLTAERSLVNPILGRLASGPNWRDAFMARLVDTGPDLNAAAHLTASLDPKIPSEREWIGTLLKRMADARRFDLAWRYAKLVMRFRDGGPPPRIWDGNFETSSPYPFGWQLVDTPSLSAQRGARPGAKGNAMLVSADSAQSGEVARQLLALPPGSYRLTALAGNLPAPAEFRLTLQVGCTDASAWLARAQNDGAANPRYTVEFRVPQGCPWQWLSITAQGGDRELSDVPWIDDVTVDRIGN